MKNRIGLIRNGIFQSLPARRIDMGITAGAGGSCRWIRRVQNGEMYVTGNGVGRTMLRSTDEGHSWTHWEMTIGEDIIPQAFEILTDDTVLVRC